MKRHLRIVIEEESVIGQWFRHSGWFASDRIPTIATTTFKPSVDDHFDFGNRVSAMLGFKWTPWESSFAGGTVVDPDMKVRILMADRRWQWLADNVETRWLTCVRTVVIDGWYRQSAQIWFEDEGDATLFKVACS
jgi:hypothetical protein